MKITFDEATRKVDFRFERDDKANLGEFKRSLHDIRETLSTDGYKRIQQYFALAREQILDSGKKCSRDPEKSKLSSERWAMLDGFDQSVLIVDKLLLDLEAYINRKESEEEEQNGQSDE
jgi:hypothetical protein